jgi:hypothetical protein
VDRPAGGYVRRTRYQREHSDRGLPERQVTPWRLNVVPAGIIWTRKPNAPAANCVSTAARHRRTIAVPGVWVWATRAVGAANVVTAGRSDRKFGRLKTARSAAALVNSVRARKLMPFGTHYAPGRRLCPRCRHRYTALEQCPDCMRKDMAFNLHRRIDPHCTCNTCIDHFQKGLTS